MGWYLFTNMSEPKNGMGNFMEKKDSKVSGAWVWETISAER